MNVLSMSESSRSPSSILFLTSLQTSACVLWVGNGYIVVVLCLCVTQMWLWLEDLPECVHMHVLEVAASFFQNLAACSWMVCSQMFSVSLPLEAWSLFHFFITLSLCLSVSLSLSPSPSPFLPPSLPPWDKALVFHHHNFVWCPFCSGLHI